MLEFGHLVIGSVPSLTLGAGTAVKPRASARGFVEQAFRLCGTDALGVCLGPPARAPLARGRPLGRPAPSRKEPDVRRLPCAQTHLPVCLSPSEHSLRTDGIVISLRGPVLAIACVLSALALRLPFAPRHLYYEDSVNFAQAVDRYDPRHLVPQPPGYPLSSCKRKRCARWRAESSRASSQV